MSASCGSASDSIPMWSHATTCRNLGGLPMAFAEFVEGGSLAEWIKEGKVSDLKQALDIAIQVAWGMKYIHSKSLIHCDLKPSNVLMTPGVRPR